MKTTERLCYISAIVLLLFYSDRKSSEVETLELLDKSNKLTASMQSDQILEMRHKISDISMMQYNKGFEDGRTHAMIASIFGDNLYDYSDGYHAALKQFDFDNPSEDMYDTILEILEVNSLLQEDYQDLLNILSKN